MKSTLTTLFCLICFLPALRGGGADEFVTTSGAPADTAFRSPALPEGFVARGEAKDARRPLPASFKWSLAPLIASQALDVASSYNMRELNPALAGSDGRFGVQSAAIKLGLTGALVGIEYLVVKIHPGAGRFFTRINWSAAAVTTGFAVHNFAIR